MRVQSFRKGYLSILTAVLLFCTVALQTRTISYAATAQTTISAETLQNGRQFTLTNMPYNGAGSIIRTFREQVLAVTQVQNFDLTPDGKYIFTVSECRTETGKRTLKHTLLTRCAVPATAGVDVQTACQDAMVLEQLGHGEVLAITQDNLKAEVYNLWVTCKPEKTQAHGQQIARLTYAIDETGAASISKTVYVGGFQKANAKNGKATYFRDKVKPEWLHCAVDPESNQIVFRTKLPSGYGSFYLSYDFAKLNRALDQLGDQKTYPIAKAVKWQKALIKCAITPLSSLQSIDVKGNQLYLCGGNKGLGAQIYVFTYDIQKNGRTTEQKRTAISDMSKVITLTTKLTINGTVYEQDKLEVEGFKVRKNADGKMDYYVSFLAQGVKLQNSMAVYKFTA